MSLKFPRKYPQYCLILTIFGMDVGHNICVGEASYHRKMITSFIDDTAKMVAAATSTVVMINIHKYVFDMHGSCC